MSCRGEKHNNQQTLPEQKPSQIFTEAAILREHVLSRQIDYYNYKYMICVEWSKHIKTLHVDCGHPASDGNQCKSFVGQL